MPKASSASKSASRKAVQLDEASQLVQEIDATTEGRVRAEEQQGGRVKKDGRKKQTELTAASVGHELVGEPLGWVHQAVARGRYMGVFPKGNDDKSNQDELEELKLHTENVVKTVINAKGDAAKLEEYLDIFSKNYIRDLETVYSMSKLELMQMGFPGGIAEVMLHLHDRIAASDVAPEEVPIPVMHTFLVKELDESPDGELFVKGTFIQTQIGQTDEHFEFRFNDASATEDNLHMRRKTHIPDFGIRTTYNVVLPTKRTQIFSAFPFQIYQISCLVELSTLAVIRDSGEYELRPDIRLWSQDERQLLVIRGVEELNSTENYALVTGSPKVTMLYDTKKKYCPKYEFAFYLAIPALQSFFSVYMPMLLVTIYSTVNVFNDAGSASQLDNAVAIATVIVFVLPQLNTESKGQDTFGTDELFIVLMFIGLILTGLIHPALSTGTCECLWAANRSNVAQCMTPYQIDLTDCQHVISYCGVAILLIANCIPIIHVYWYLKCKNQIYKTSVVEDAGKSAGAEKKSQRKNSVAPDGTPLPVANGVQTRQAFVTSKSLKKWEPFDKKKKELNIERLEQLSPCCTPVKGRPKEWEKSPMLDKRWRSRTMAGKKNLIKLQCGPDHRAGY